jgi:hypothetical protein
MKLRTWHLEMAFVAILLGGVAAWRGTWLDALGALAVVLTFGHTAIAERMRESQAQLRVPFSISEEISISSGVVICDGAAVTVPPQSIKLGEAHGFVECHALLTKYLVGKEVAWVIFFLLSKSYPALIGCAVFLLYPVWRTWWRRGHPLV